MILLYGKSALQIEFCTHVNPLNYNLETLRLDICKTQTVETYGQRNCSSGPCLRFSKMNSNNSRTKRSTLIFCNPPFNSNFCFELSGDLILSETSSNGS